MKLFSLIIVSIANLVSCGMANFQQSAPLIWGVPKKVSSVTLSPFSMETKSSATTAAEIVPEVSLICLRTQSHLMSIPSVYSNAKIFYPISSSAETETFWNRFSSPQSFKIDNAKIFAEGGNDLTDAKGNDSGCYVSISFLVYDLRVDRKDMITIRSSKNLLEGASQSQKNKLDLLFREHRPIANVDVTWSSVDQKTQPEMDLFVSTDDVASKIAKFEVKNIDYKCVDCDEDKIIYNWQANVEFEILTGSGTIHQGTQAGIYLTGSRGGPLLTIEKSKSK